MAILKNRWSRVHGRFVAVVVVSALALTGCVPSEEPVGENAATGEPILVGAIGEQTGPITAYPGIPRMLEERFKQINANGGVGGRPLELVYCDTQAVADQVSRCMREIVDKGAVFLLNAAVLAGADKVNPLAEAAGLPYSSTAATFPFDYTSPMSFPVITYIGATIGAAYLQAQEGCENPVAFAVDGPAVDFLKELSALGTEAGGGEEVTWVSFPSNTTDYAPIAQQITDLDPDCILPYSSETVNALMYPALMQTGWKERSKDNRLIGYMGGVYTDGSLAEFPEFLEGTRVVDLTPPTTDPRWEDFNAIITQLRAENLGNLGSGFMKSTWVNLEVLLSAIEILQADDREITRENLVDVYSNETLDAGGLVDPFKAESLGIERWPRMFNAKFYVEEIGPNGTIELVNGLEMVDFSEELREIANRN